MNDPKEKDLDVVISYILIIGVIASVLLETAGIIGLFYSDGNVDIVFSPEFSLKGSNFFAYAGQAIQDLLLGKWTPISILTFGLLLLMVTPYLRVVASAGFFAAERNVKYFFITLFVLIILTGSLLAH